MAETGLNWRDPAGGRCPICDWPFARDRTMGCVADDCSYRPGDPAEQARIAERRTALALARGQEQERK